MALLHTAHEPRYSPFYLTPPARMLSQVFDGHICTAHGINNCRRAVNTGRASHPVPAYNCACSTALPARLSPPLRPTHRSPVKLGRARALPALAAHTSALALGIDFGTSGARCCIVEGTSFTLADGDCKFSACQKNSAHAEGSSSIVQEVSTSFDKLRSEDWVGPWTRYRHTLNHKVCAACADTAPWCFRCAGSTLQLNDAHMSPKPLCRSTASHTLLASLLMHAHHSVQDC